MDARQSGLPSSDRRDTFFAIIGKLWSTRKCLLRSKTFLSVGVESPYTFWRRMRSATYFPTHVNIPTWLFTHTPKSSCAFINQRTVWTLSIIFYFIWNLFVQKSFSRLIYYVFLPLRQINSREKVEMRASEKINRREICVEKRKEIRVQSFFGQLRSVQQYEESLLFYFLLLFSWSCCLLSVEPCVALKYCVHLYSWVFTAMLSTLIPLITMLIIYMPFRTVCPIHVRDDLLRFIGKPFRMNAFYSFSLPVDDRAIPLPLPSRPRLVSRPNIRPARNRF